MATKERPILFSGPMVLALLDGRKTQTRRVVKPQPMPHSPYRPASLPGDWTWQNKSCYSTTVSNKPNGPDGWAAEHCPYGAPGDVLWVREAWGKSTDARGTGVFRYQADDSARFVLAEDGGEGDWCGLAGVADAGRCNPVERWKPSIHMPRWACRITLEIVSVRVERVESITDADAMAEGIIKVAKVGETPETAGQVAWWWGTEVIPDKYGSADLRRLIHEKSPREAFLRLFYDLNERAPRGANPWVWVIEFRRVP